MDTPNLSTIDASEPRRFCKAITLRNGTPVLIRAARADDRERLITAFQGLDRQTIYTRYLSFRKSLSQTELDRLDHADSGRDILLVATLGEGRSETIIAGASCIAIDGGGPSRSAGVVHLAMDLPE